MLVMIVDIESKARRRAKGHNRRIKEPLVNRRIEDHFETNVHTVIHVVFYEGFEGSESQTKVAHKALS
jgi:hypothetical protein